MQEITLVDFIELKAKELIGKRMRKQEIEEYFRKIINKKVFLKSEESLSEEKDFVLVGNLNGICQIEINYLKTNIKKIIYITKIEIY